MENSRNRQPIRNSSEIEYIKTIRLRLKDDYKAFREKIRIDKRVAEWLTREPKYRKAEALILFDSEAQLWVIEIKLTQYERADLT